MAEKLTDQDYIRMAREIAQRHATTQSRASNAPSKRDPPRDHAQRAKPIDNSEHTHPRQSSGAQGDIYAPQLHVHDSSQGDGRAGVNRAELLRTALCVMRRPLPGDVVSKNWWWIVPSWIALVVWGIFGIVNGLWFIGILAVVAFIGLYFLAWARTMRFFQRLGRTVSDARVNLIEAGDHSVGPVLLCPYCNILPTVSEAVRGSDGGPACFLCGTRLV